MVRSEKIPTNDAATTLDGAINDSTTSITVTDGSVFPSEGDYRVIVGSELMIVTARSTNVLTVTRGAESSTASSHASGASIAQIITAGGLQKYVTDWLDPWAFDRPPNRLLDASGNVLTASDFTQNNMGTGTLADAVDGSLVLSMQSRTPPNLAGLTRTAPSTPYTITAHMMMGPIEMDNDDSEFVLGFRETSSSKLQYVMFAPPLQHEIQYLSDFNAAVGVPSDTSNILGPIEMNNDDSEFVLGFRETSSSKLQYVMFAPPLQHEIQYLSDFNAAVGVPSDTSNILGPRRSDWWFRIEDDGTDLNFFASSNGVHWYEQHTEARNSWFTTGPDEVFWGGTTEQWATLQPITLLSWLEA